MSNGYDTYKSQQSPLSRVIDRIVKFAGSVSFLAIHAIWFALWIGLGVEPFPFGLLTMIVSLEAIFLSTLVMISQNRQEERDKVQAKHEYEHQERELKVNTELTQSLHTLTEEIHRATVKPGANQ